MTTAEITRLDPEAADELKKLGVSGDLGAARDYLLYAAWRHIDGWKGYSRRAKVRAFSAIADRFQVRWQTTSS